MLRWSEQGLPAWERLVSLPPPEIPFNLGACWSWPPADGVWAGADRGQSCLPRLLPGNRLGLGCSEPNAISNLIPNLYPCPGWAMGPFLWIPSRNHIAPRWPDAALISHSTAKSCPGCYCHRGKPSLKTCWEYTVWRGNEQCSHGKKTSLSCNYF